MAGRTLVEMQNPVTQSVEGVKALLTWKGRAVDPLPAIVEFTQEDKESRLVLVLSNEKNGYYTCTPEKCSCPAATNHQGPCKHQRKFFPGPQKSREEQEAESDAILAAQNGLKRLARPPEDSIRSEGKWPGGFNGPVDEIREAA